MKLYCTDPDHEDFGTFIQDVFLENSGGYKNTPVETATEELQRSFHRM